jgi:phosphatidylserine/phosphatidylglycerophosphate/cardiolipin synthase-like enzyme
VSTNPLKKMSAEALYMQLGRLIEEMPDLTAKGPASHETLRWLGRAHALVAEAEGLAAEMELQHYRGTWADPTYRPASAERITGILYRALATVETELPGSFSGAFIPAGNVFDAMAAVGRVFASAKNELLIIDPYLDEKILTEFASLAPAGVRLRLLCDAAGYKDSLVTAAQKWIQQNSTTRPLEIKVAPARTLHDRLIVVDRTTIYTVGQSFNALATRAPTSFGKSNPETTALKVVAYEDVWKNASLLA